MHTCDPSRTATGPATLAVCSACGDYEWTDRRGARMEPSDAIAAAFGSCVLIGQLDSIAAPAGTALVYRVPTSYRARLDAFAVGAWTRIHPNLFGSQDGVNLLLAPSDPDIPRRLGQAG